MKKSSNILLIKGQTIEIYNDENLTANIYNFNEQPLEITLIMSIHENIKSYLMISYINNKNDINLYGTHLIIYDNGKRIACANIYEED